FLVEHGLNNVADRGASIGVAPGLRDPVAALEGPVTGPSKIFGAFYGGMGAHGYPTLSASPSAGEGCTGPWNPSMHWFRASQASRSACLRASAARSAEART